MPGRSRRTPEQAQRLARVVALRRDRWTQADIAAELGISQQRVSQLYHQALAEVPAAEVRQYRAEELLLIDDAVRDLLLIARNHRSPRVSVEAWTCIRGWADRRAKLLALDAPARHEVRNIDEIDAQLQRLAEEIDLGGPVDPMQPSPSSHHC